MKIKEKVNEFIEDYRSSLITGSLVILLLMLLALVAYYTVIISSIVFAIGLLGYLYYRSL